MEQAKKWDVECVIYDCDGVLFDSFDANRRLYNSIAVAARSSVLDDDELHYCHTHTVYQSIAHICRNDAESERRALEFFRNTIDFRDFIVYLKMEPNVKETLERLRARGISRAISTNRTTSMRHIMEQYGLWEYFDVVVTAAHQANPGSDGTGSKEILQAKSKPDPEGVEKILGALNVRREATLYIGDSEVDMGTARSSGVRFIAYKNDTLEADVSIDDHLALLDFLSNG
ncbi:MAG: HAD family hydrolase [Syntrophorhabdaceae bacterium]|nr:HAD family hydrolase [Syntrophorhabdaceae bacterium]